MNYYKSPCQLQRSYLRGSKTSVSRYEITSVCKSCKEGMHQSCAKVRQEKFATFICTCSCHEIKNSTADEVSRPKSVVSSRSSSKTPRHTSDNNYTNDEDMDLSKRPTVLMKSHEQLIGFSRSFDINLDNIRKQDIEHFWETFLGGGNNQ